MTMGFPKSLPETITFSYKKVLTSYLTPRTTLILDPITPVTQQFEK